ncbi:MAG: sigma factor-like helix-turn-helix DNA-binding protein [Snowella sp.]
MITENNVIESIKDSVNLADVSPENFESTVQFIHRQYEIVLKAKDKEIEERRQEISHLRKMVESLAKEPIVINLENKKNVEGIQEIEHLSSTEISPIKYEIPENEISDDLLWKKLVNLASVVDTLSFTEKQGLRNVLATLSQPERDILALLLGLDDLGDGRTQTLEEIKQIFGVTEERIRQIQFKPLSKIRDSNTNSLLKEYILQNI